MIANPVRLTRAAIAIVLAALTISCERQLTPPGATPVAAVVNAASGSSGQAKSQDRSDAELNAPPRLVAEPIDEVYPARPPAVKPQPALKIAAIGDLTVSFQNADLPQVLRVILGDLLRVNYLLPADLQGKVTLRTARPLTRAQMFGVLDHVLDTHGLAAVHEPDVTRIVASQTATAGATSQGAQVPGYGLEVLALSYIGAAQMQSLLAPVLAKGRVLLADPTNNLIILSGTASERAAARRTVDVFDIDQMASQGVALIGLEHAEAEAVIGELRQLFGDDAKGPLGGLVRFVPVKRMNAILAIARQPDYLDRAREWIRRLDRTRDADQRRLFVYFVKNGAAVQLVKTLRGAFGIGSSDPGDGAGISSSINAGTETKAGETNPAKDNPRAPRFMADVPSNALLVWATKREYDVISEVLAKLDITPLQVLIEGTVIEITLRDRLRYGLQYFLEFGDVTAIFSRDSSQTTVNPTVPGFGVTISGSNNSKLVIDALSDLTDVRVVSSPQLLVVDGETARLHVGDQVPIVTRSSSTSVTDDARIVNEIEYRDTGVTLHVTPKIKASGMVSLEIIQEVSSVVRTDSSNIDSPTIQQRRINSTAAVKNGATVMLAGLIREREDDLESGIPGLHQLPVIGSLFGNTNSDRQRTELIVLITPRVIRDQVDAQNITRDLLRRYEGVLDSLGPRPNSPSSGATKTEGPAERPTVPASGG
ncbi:MAG: type II secretion system secretin GspD [Proteobacteria bacterium]|nr:type II secretion system secretin GspD [Pseudomonadota bacterium]